MVWDAANGTNLLTLRGHTRPIKSVAFSPDGDRIVTASADETVKVWEAISGKELLTLTGFSERSARVTFSPDGQRIISGSLEPAEKVWQAATPAQVGVWQKDEKSATERAAIRRREREQAAAAERDRALRGQDPGVIRQWLVLVPRDAKGGKGAAALKQKEIPDEANRRPHADERVNVGESEWVWSAVQLKGYMLDFKQLLAEATASDVGYAVCYIVCAADQTGLVMKVGSPKASIYLNGKEIYRRTEPRGYAPDNEVVAGVELKAGLNVLVFKVPRASVGWNGSVRFTDAEGNPVKGIKVTLTP